MSKRQKNLDYNPWIELTARWFLGAVFLYASYPKIVNPDHFAKIVYGYYLFPDAAINLIAIVLPFLEFFGAVALILGVYPRSAALLLNGLILAFIIVLSINLWQGKQFDCGCFSFEETGYTYTAGQLLVRDTVLFFLGLLVLLFGQERKGCLWQTGGLFKTIHPRPLRNVSP